jgi:hypothetical protein
VRLFSVRPKLPTPALAVHGRPYSIHFDQAEEVVIVSVLSVEKAEDTVERSYVDGVRSATLISDKVFKGKLQVRDEIVFGHKCASIA